MLFKQTFQRKFSIVTIIGTMFCAIAALIAFEQWTEQKATPVPVDTRTYPNNSSETEFKEEFDSPIAVGVKDTVGQMNRESHKSPVEMGLTGNQAVNSLWLTSALNIDQPLWLSSQKYPEKGQQSDKFDLSVPMQKFSIAKIESPKKNEDDDEEASGSQPDEANRFRNLQLQDENGEIPLDGLQRAREQMDLMRDAEQKKAVAEGKPDGLEVASIAPLTWTWLGPGNIGGRIRSIVIDPVDPNKMWVGSVSGGIWKTTNAGGAWFPINDFMANLAVSTMVIDPTNSNIMYAGTGESFAANTGVIEGNRFSPDGLRGAGIFKSSNGGVTWSQLAETNPSNNVICPNPVTPGNCPWLYINRLAISPDGSTLLAATLAGIYRSPDGGGTWNLTPSFNGNIQDTDFDPTNSLKAIAARDTPRATASYSTDGGQTWTAATFSPAIIPYPIISPSNQPKPNRIEIAYAPSNPSIVYASVDEQSAPTVPPTPVTFQGTIYKSIDGGQNYTRINMSNYFLGSQGDYDNIIWVNPQDPNFVIVGGISMYATTDGGTNWNTIADGSNGSAHSDHHMIVAHPGFNNTTNKKVYFSNDGGIYKTDDVSTVSIAGGWTKLNNDLGITQFYGAAANSDGVIVGGTQDNGTLKYSGNPQAWTSMFGGDGGYSAADPTDPNYFYGEYINLGMVRSTNGGSSASYIYCNPAPTNPNGGPCVAPAVGIMDAFNGANFIAPFILDPGDSNTMLAGGLSLWRSNDIKAAGIPTWTAIKPPVSNGLIPPTILPISAIAVSPNNSNFIVVGHNNGQMYLTLDGTGINPPTTNQCSPGNSPCWSRIDNAGTPNRFVTRLVIDENKSPNWIYATFGGFNTNNVFVTKDLGVTWADVSGVTGSATDLPAVPVRSLLINPVRPNLIYVGTEVGVFASEDAGTTWRLPQDGPANVSVDELFWLKGSLVAVTHGRGLYKTSNRMFIEPICATPLNCPCYGKWDCPCTWGGNNAIPTADDDVVVRCPISIQLTSNGAAKNITVQNRLTIDGTLSVAEDVLNGKIITSSPGVSSGLLQCRNLSNASNFHSNEGLISVDVSASGNVTNSGVMAQNTFRVLGNLDNFGSIVAQQGISVGGDVVNVGPPINAVLRAPNLGLTGSPSRIKNFSGLGLWEFGTAVVPAGYTLKLGSDLPFDIADFNNNGTVDFSDKTLTFKGNSFQNSGTNLGTGILRFAPTGGNSIFLGNGPAVTIASGTVKYQSGGTISGPLTIDSGAVFSMNTSGSLTANSNVTVNGTLNKFGITPVFNFNGQTFRNNGTVGNIDFINFNSGGGPPVQFIAGSGSWSPTNIQIGKVGSPTIVNLSNSVTFASNQLSTAAGSTLNVSNFTLTLAGPTNFFTGKISGTGLVKMQPTSGSPRLGSSFAALTIDPAVEIASGTVQATSTLINGKLTIDSGATLSLFDTIGIESRGDVENNGTLNAFSGSSSLKFKGGTFTNNGFVTGNVFVNFGDFFGPPVIQNLGGTGSWAGSPGLYFGSTSTTTLLNDFTYNGGNLSVDGRLNTGAFTLSLPCNVPWGGSGDVIGSIRRTNLAACPGVIFAFGNPFTTIQFTSGTPPTDITVNVGLTTPAGFPNAAARTYVITPTGGSNYTANLRLHYLDSELNGNAESTLQLWRNNGSNWTPQGATNRNTTQNWVEYAGVTQFSPWAISGPLAPTAASVTVSGRIQTSDGRGIRNARMTITNQSGTTRTAITSSFGYYRFEDVQAGETYIISVHSRRFQFANPTQVLAVSDEITDMNFTALP